MIFNTPILQIKNPRPREVKWYACGQTDIQKQDMDQNSGSLTTKPIHFRSSFLASILLLIQGIMNN